MKATYLVVIPIILKFDSNIVFFLTIIKKIYYKYFFLSYDTICHLCIVPLQSKTKH